MLTQVEWYEFLKEKEMASISEEYQSYGHAKGLAEGLAEGRAEGEKNRALKDALMLLEDGMVTRSYIHEKLGITEDELQKALDAKKPQTPPE
jgi:flagellar biosynthesis/type III secretory pathway protein FliH